LDGIFWKEVIQLAWKL